MALLPLLLQFNGGFCCGASTLNCRVHSSGGDGRYCAAECISILLRNACDNPPALRILFDSPELYNIDIAEGDAIYAR